jgi:DNA-binding MarR family transcriptional regulator
MAQMGLLMRLHHHGGCGVSEIADDFGITAAAASQLIDRLVQSGHVDRSENPQDRRARILDLSKLGREIVDRGMSERFRWVDELAEALPAEVRSAVAETLPALIEAEGRLPGAEPDRFPHLHSPHRSEPC